MTTRRWRMLGGDLLTIFLAGYLMAAPAAWAEDKDKLEIEKIPKPVMEALKAKFPKADIRKWTKEKEGDTVVYDIEFNQADHKFEADIKEDGVIHNWEKAITAKSLPKVVKKAVRKQYRKSTLKEVMEITEIKDGKDVLEGYEIVLETRRGKQVEVTVAPDGRILEDSGAAK